jgi:hypothetical protein
MARNLTVPFTIGNGARMRYVLVSLSTEAGEITVEATMRTAVGGTPPDAEVSTKRFSIRNGRSDRLFRGTVLSGGTLRGALRVDADLVSSPTGFTDALAAYRTSDNAFENHVATAAVGYVDAGLAST